MKLYFAGSPGRALKFAQGPTPKLGTRKLLNYQTEKTDLTKWMDLGMQLFVDSGAYTVHTHGGEIDLDGYIDYLNEHNENVAIAAQLDEIPGKFNHPKSQEDYRLASQKTFENYMYMRARLKSPDKCIPLFHQGVHMKYLKKYLEMGVPYIGISPSNDLHLNEKIKWLRNVFGVIRKSSNPNVKTHAFGLTALDVLQHFEFTSADSTTWVLTGAFGAIMTPLGRIPVSEQTGHKPGGLTSLSSQKREKLKQYVESMGEDLDELVVDTESRIRLNVKYLLDWEENYNFVGSKLHENILF